MGNWCEYLVEKDDIKCNTVVSVSLDDPNILRWRFTIEGRSKDLIVSGSPLSIVYFYAIHYNLRFSDVALSKFEDEWERIILS